MTKHEIPRHLLTKDSAPPGRWSSICGHYRGAVGEVPWKPDARLCLRCVERQAEWTESKRSARER